MSVKTLALASLVTAAFLLGCGSGDDSSTNKDASTNGGAIVTGSAKCDQPSIQDALKSWSEANGGEEATLPSDSGSYQCADGWAVAFPNVGTGEEEVTVTAVFEAEGQFWIPKNRSQVCGKTAANSDVPKSLYKAACQTN